MKQVEFVGPNSVGFLGSTLDEVQAKKVFLVCDKASFGPSGAAAYMSRLPGRFEVVSFSDFVSNPNIADLHVGLERFRQANCDVIVAIGGGSVIDMAKMIGFFAGNAWDPEEYLRQKPKTIRGGKPLVAIPTTAGTGSEATHFAVLYVGKAKHSIAHEAILPTVAIVDYELTLSLPPRITAECGMDALSQAIESYWCIYSTDESKTYSREALKLVFSNLAVAVRTPNNASREAMAIGAHLAGKAINITKTTAPHAISYPLTSHFGIPHGHAAALTLSSFLLFNSGVGSEDVLDPRGCEYVCRTIQAIVSLLGGNDVLEARKTIDALMRQIGLETTLRSAGIRSTTDVEKIIEEGFNPDRVNNNPRRLTAGTLRRLLTDIY